MSKFSTNKVEAVIFNEFVYPQFSQLNELLELYVSGSEIL